LQGRERKLTEDGALIRYPLECPVSLAHGVRVGRILDVSVDEKCQ
jgi:hypothetical protein